MMVVEITSSGENGRYRVIWHIKPGFYRGVGRLFRPYTRFYKSGGFIARQRESVDCRLKTFYA